MAHALNVVGKEPNSVLGTFNEVIKFLPTIGYETKAMVSFYEIITNINILSDKNPKDVLNNSLRIDLQPFNEIRNIGLTGVMISNREEVQDNELFSLIIEPSSISPSSKFVVKLQYRSSKTEDIISFQKSLEEKIIAIIKSIE